MIDGRAGNLHEGIQLLINRSYESPYRSLWSEGYAMEPGDIVVPSLHVNNRHSRQGCILLDRERKPKAFKWTSEDWDEERGEYAMPLDAIPSWWYGLCSCDRCYWYVNAEPFEVGNWWKQYGFVFAEDDIPPLRRSCYRGHDYE